VENHACKGDSPDWLWRAGCGLAGGRQVPRWIVLLMQASPHFSPGGGVAM